MPIQDQFDSQIAYNPDADELVTGATFQVFASDDSAFATPLPITDPASGAGIPTLRSSSIGVLPDFRVPGDPPQVILKSGAFVTLLTSKFGAVLAAGLDPDTVAAAIAAAAAAQASASQAQTVVEQTAPAAAAAAVDEMLATRDVSTSLPVAPEFPDDEGFLGDADGRPSKVGFDVDGEIAEATMRSAHGKGMPRLTVIDDGDGGFYLADAEGNRYALGFDSTGQFDTTTKWALANLLHSYTGPDQPFVWPGNFILWQRVDLASGHIETLMGEN
ncbi:hypothetical protein HF576_01815 [Microbacterium sp. CFH 90308]|uniref:Uncharacterized protein n=1 Tax=Microbacterium salsuginis TaxID=2722803 RepID=A0ABX1K8Y5_9MICO|nr:hypothetical protein [Microbacterium sp. CFH 90308]NLP82575.1 hypothetical protein [Microbacterium sp. CFH 90308]